MSGIKSINEDGIKYYIIPKNFELFKATKNTDEIKFGLELDNPKKSIHINNMLEIEDYEPFIIYSNGTDLYQYHLFCITRSDYYSINIKTEIGKKRQQFKNIVDSWLNINEGNKKINYKKSIQNQIIYNYFLNIEYDLVRALLILSKYL